jgi:hypothetical protein
MERLASQADGLAELAAGIGSLAPGYGRAAVTRYLTPLRDHWPVAAELPATPAVRAAATDLGFLDEFEDEESAPGRLSRLVSGNESVSGESPALPGLIDLEAALERLGRRACVRGAAGRCPLGARCPRRA